MLLAGLLTLELPLQAQLQAGTQNQTMDQGQKKKKTLPADMINSIKGKVNNKTTGEGISLNIVLYYGMDTTRFERFSETLSNTDGGYEILLPDSGLHKFFKLVFLHENYIERVIVVDKDRIPHFLPVRLVPLVFVEITATYPRYEVGREYETAGIPVKVHQYGGVAVENPVVVHTNFRQRLKNFFRRIFR